MDLDPVLHHPTRLKLAMLMASGTNASFNELARETGLTPGNLQSHLKALETAGYLESWRGLVDLKPRMRYRLTEGGREALRAYCATLRQMVQAIDRAVESPDATDVTRMS